MSPSPRLSIGEFKILKLKKYLGEVVRTDGESEKGRNGHSEINNYQYMDYMVAR